MSKKVFITYGDENFLKSAKRLKCEAETLGIFDSLRVYRPKDLPDCIKNSFTYSFSRGGGYWLWKPYLILERLKSMSFGDVLLYADAGCKLYNSSEWQIYFDKLETHDAIFFQYKDEEYPWGMPVLKNWIKKSTINFFQADLLNYEWLDKSKFWAGAMFIKKNNETLELIDDWYKIMALRPDLLVDTFGPENYDQEPYFIEHRHDQAILSALLLIKPNDKFLYLPENSEIKREGQPIFKAGIKDIKKNPFYIRLKFFMKSRIGSKKIEQTRKLFRF